MELFGYIRVSTLEQNDDRQHIALEPFGIPKYNIFVDKQSGKDFERPAYRRMVKRLQKGDLLYVKSIDRLGRDYAEVIEEWRVLTRYKGIDIKILDMPLLDTTYHKDLLGSFISDLVLQVMSFSSQLERDNLLQRQSEGIAAAKSRGVSFGRPIFSPPEDFDSICDKWRSGELTREETAEICGCSVRTLYNKTRGWRD